MRLGTLVGAGLCALLCSSPSALALSTPQATAAVGAKAATLAAPSTPSIAAANQQALQPSVDAALAKGRAAISALLAYDNPDIASDVARDMKLIEVASTTVPATTLAAADPISTNRASIERTTTTFEHGRVVRRVHRRILARTAASGCWGAHTTADYVGASTSVWIAWRKVTENGWCGNGTGVTSINGATYSSDEIGIYCWNDVEHNQGYKSGPAGPHVWWHAQNYAVLGGDYAFGCASQQTVAPSIEVKGNGFWDHGF